MRETCIRRKEKVVNLDHLIRSYVTLAIIADLLHDCVEGTAANVWVEEWWRTTLPLPTFFRVMVPLMAASHSIKPLDWRDGGCKCVLIASLSHPGVQNTEIILTTWTCMPCVSPSRAFLCPSPEDGRNKMGTRQFYCISVPGTLSSSQESLNPTARLSQWLLLSFPVFFFILVSDVSIHQAFAIVAPEVIPA